MTNWRAHLQRSGLGRPWGDGGTVTSAADQVGVAKRRLTKERRSGGQSAGRAGGLGGCSSGRKSWDDERNDVSPMFHWHSHTNFFSRRFDELTAGGMGEPPGRRNGRNGRALSKAPACGRGTVSRCPTTPAGVV